MILSVIVWTIGGFWLLIGLIGAFDGDVDLLIGGIALSMPFVLAGIVLHLRRKLKKQRKQIDAMQNVQEEDAPAAGTADDMREEMHRYVANELYSFGRAIKDKEISREIADIRDIINKKAALSNEAPDREARLAQLTRFLEHYFPTIKKILSAYAQIEGGGLNVKSAVETKARIAAALPGIRKAFENELEKMYQTKMLDITTDIDALEAMLEKDGLIDNGTLKF